ncbi:HlyD family secretion protein [Aidingimonas lacisalsi]|uniref:HlyD family secretion protein n=1 Tax=Aidingimonas lacisalsi TaxID=2604086 RepID=UPI0011D254A7|nr:HlyD family secretion protein [Aidingimonas lacisalsi]
MTPEQRFARWVRVAIAAFIVLFVYFVIADTYMPMTPQARAMRPVTTVAPEVDGRVVSVDASNNSRVHEGDVLFTLDAEPYRLALQQARLAREEARRDNARLKAELAAARAELVAAQTSADELEREQRRYATLAKRQEVSQQAYEQRLADYRSAQASVDAARANVESLEVELGDDGEANLRLRQAENAVAQAELDLERTRVRADHAGVVTNLQLQSGSVLSAGTAVLALVDDELDIVADFREKALRHVSPGDPVRVVFDAWPGQVFEARVSSRDAGIQDGQLSADGRLVDIAATDRWVRDAQRLRLHVTLDRPLDTLPASGARATVQLLPDNHWLAKPFAWLQIHGISWIHYVY